MMAKVKKQNPQELYKARKAREEEERVALLPPGLYNAGNTCFLNSVLQGLIATSLLEDLIRLAPPSPLTPGVSALLSPALTNGRGGEFGLERVNGMPLSDIFIRMMERAWMLRDERARTSMSPREVLNRLGAKFDQYLDFRQQDSHELLRHLLDGMYMEELDIIKKRQPPPPKKQKRRRRAQSDSNAEQEPTPPLIPEGEKLRPFADQIFGGKFASILVCEECKHVSHTYEDFMDVSLSIKPEEDKDSKKGRLKSFALKFRRQAALVVPRPQSTPPNPVSPAPVTPPREEERRLSLDRQVSPKRSDSDPELPNTSQQPPSTGDPPHPTTPPPPHTKDDGLTRLGRRVSTQLGMRKNAEGDSAGKLVEDGTDPSRKGKAAIKVVLKPKPPKPTKEEAAYLRRILADSAPPLSQQLNPMAILRMANGGPAVTAGELPSSNGGGSSSATAWLKLGTPGHGLIDCLRLFTAVEALDGENMVGCRRCWKIANSIPLRPNWNGEEDDEDEDEDEDDQPRAEPPLGLENPLRPLGENPTNGKEGGVRPVQPRESVKTPTGIEIDSTLTESSSALSTSAESSAETDLSSSTISKTSTFPSSMATTEIKDVSPNGNHAPLLADKLVGSGIDDQSTSKKTERSATLQPEVTFAGQPIPSISTTSPDIPPVPLPVAPEPNMISIRHSRYLSADNSLRPHYSPSETSDDDSADESASASGISSDASSTPAAGVKSSRGRPTSGPLSIPRSKQVILRKAYKRYLIAKPPPVLVVHLKRFQQVSKSPVTFFGSNFKKIDDYVSFPEYLDLKPFVAPRREDYLKKGKKDKEKKEKEEEQVMYRLYAVVVHIGNMLGGHYIAYTALPKPPPPTPSKELQSKSSLPATATSSGPQPPSTAPVTQSQSLERGSDTGPAQAMQQLSSSSSSGTAEVPTQALSLKPKSDGKGAQKSDPPKSSKADPPQVAKAEKADSKTAAKNAAAPAPKSDRQWCYISDHNVRLISFEEVLKSKAYLCFYERV